MDLQAYLKKTIINNELRNITTEVDPKLEVAKLCRREFATPLGGKALLFHNVKGSKLPVVANLFGSQQRACQLLRVDSYADFAIKIDRLLKRRNGSVAQRLKINANFSVTNEHKLPLAPNLTLSDLPVIRSWPQEKYGYFSLAMAISEHPETGVRNIGLYRAQYVDGHRLALNFSPGSGIASHLRVAAKLNQSLPISLVLGSDPALLWLAAAPLPSDCDEFAFYQEMFDERLILTPGITNNLLVPNNAEVIIEGTIFPAETINEGPFGNHTGQYVSRDDCPVVQVSALRHGVDPIIPITVVGPPPSENIYIAKANEILLRQMIMIDFPQVNDLHMPLETIFHGVAMLSVKSQSSAANRKLIETLWHNSPLSRSKLMVLFDEDLDISSLSQCWWRIINRLDFKLIYRDGGRTAFDATGISPDTMVDNAEHSSFAFKI